MYKDYIPSYLTEEERYKLMDEIILFEAAILQARYEAEYNASDSIWSKIFSPGFHKGLEPLYTEYVVEEKNRLLTIFGDGFRAGFKFGLYTEVVNSIGTGKKPTKGAGSISKEVAELGENKINHILQEKHQWNKVVDDPNNWEQVSKVISQTLENYMKQIYKKCFTLVDIKLLFQRSFEMNEQTEKFLINQGEPIIQSSLDTVTKYYQTNQAELIKGFQKSFLELCNGLRQMKSAEPTAYIQYHLLRTSILSNENKYLLEARNKDGLLGQTANISYGYYDASWLYRYYHQAVKDISAEGKKFASQINSLDLELLYRKIIFYYHRYIETIAEDSLDKGFITESIPGLLVEEELVITVGEYLDNYKEIISIS